MVPSPLACGIAVTWRTATTDALRISKTGQTKVNVVVQPEGESNVEKEITVWIKAVEDGDDAAASELWSYCFPRLLNYSKKKLPSHLRRALDEEDVALSAFKSFCLAAAKGNFPELQGRDDLWRLLLCIASRKDGFSLH